MALSARLDMSRAGGAFDDWYRFAEQRMERAALIATDRAATQGKADVRAAMSSAGIGRLGNAIGSTSDLKQGGRVHRRSNGFSASGILYVRSRSERTLGAIEAYTEGANILPRKGRWLWFPSDEIRRIGGTGSEKRRLTPGNWVKFGMDRKIGPLVRVTTQSGRPLLIVKDVGVNRAGKARSARARTKRGGLRKGDVAVSIIAFIGIPRTSREARVDVRHVLSVVQGQMPNYFAEALGRI